jgi:hypothetical protein
LGFRETPLVLAIGPEEKRPSWSNAKKSNLAKCLEQFLATGDSMYIVSSETKSLAFEGLRSFLLELLTPRDLFWV